MLETLIKRNGEKQDFNNSKANRWMLWAGEDLEGRMDWMTVISNARKTSPREMQSQDWQKRLIKDLAVRGNSADGWAYMVMSGRLNTVLRLKEIHGKKYPTLSEHLKQIAPYKLSRVLNYTESDLEFINDHILDHNANMEMTYFQVEQYYSRYSLRHQTMNRVFETPQFTMIRMAMAVAEGIEDKHARLEKVRFLYRQLRNDLINPPTPNYSALGTNHYGMASCCLIAVGDTADSIAAGGLVAEMITLASAGIGLHLDVRSLGDPVNNGRVEHGGKLSYIRKFVKQSVASKQGTRGGALKISVPIYDPEVEMLAKLQNPRTPAQAQERQVNVAIQDNAFFARLAAQNKDYFTFNSYTAPDLYEAFSDADQSEFERLYAKYEADENFVKNYRSAYDTLVMVLNQQQEISTLFEEDPSYMNAHTPYKRKIRQSNLCTEIDVTTTPWKDVASLYGDGNPDNGETGICNIGSVSVHNMPFDISDPAVGYREHKAAVKAMQEIADFAITNGEYKFPAIAIQAKARRNTGIGMSGVATLMASLNLKFNSAEGRRAWHVLNERHAYVTIESALELGQERGNAEWMHETKWPEGWLPVDTYKKTIDSVVDSRLVYDWENLRQRIIANGGIRFSTVIAHMPGEQSTRKGTGSNSVYPLFSLYVDKADGSNSILWAAKDNDLIGHQYQMAYDSSDEDMAIWYGICQKFTDNGISADYYKDRNKELRLSAEKLVDAYLARKRYGSKAKYYSRSKTPQAPKQGEIKVSAPSVATQPEVLVFEPEAPICEIGGACSN